MSVNEIIKLAVSLLAFH